VVPCKIRGAGHPHKRYEWWRKASDCRIPFADERYIQPDICGRDVASFYPGAHNRSVIIEVIQTHYPEEETFFRLLQLSKQNRLVVFYFIALESYQAPIIAMTFPRKVK
jgi:hypothetical protein